MFFDYLRQGYTLFLAGEDGIALPFQNVQMRRCTQRSLRFF